MMRIKMLFLLLLCCIEQTHLRAQSFTPAEIKAWKKQSANVEIIRDNWGIPHVYGVTDADAVFGLMYAQAEDDYRAIEEYFIGRLGKRAMYLGEENLSKDLYDAI